jgi:ATP-dependent protease HslVU (ClpYQ) peptidase subunit
VTVIAWDGKTLAGDKLTSFGGMHATTTKVHRINGCLVGGSGNSAQIQEMLAWLRAGADVDKFPSSQRCDRDCATILVIHPDGQVRQYEHTPYPLVIHNTRWAIGSGRDFALAAMHLGQDAVKAVELACVLDTGCGNGVDSLTLDAPPDPA